MQTWAGRLAALVVIALIVASGVMLPVDRALREIRFDWLGRDATGSLTIVEIDAASLDAAGSWPFSRELYASALRNLKAAGAEVVGFDVDFSARGAADADRAFADEIAQSPHQVILPAFVQRWRHDHAAIGESSPAASLSGDAVLANVNLFPDRDGVVRHGILRSQVGVVERASMAAALAGDYSAAGQVFFIDYGVNPNTIPRLSFMDVVQGEFDPALVRGQRVLIGATALELGDELAVPVHGILSGVVVHALSYESIVQRRMLWPTPPVIVGVLCAFFFGWRVRRRPDALSWKNGVASGLVVAAALAIPFGVQAAFPISLDLALVLACETMWLLYVLLAELQRRARALIEQREAMLHHQATHDAATGLPNYRALCEQIGTVEDDAAYRWLVIVGVERIASIQSALGHQAGLVLLQDIAERLRLILPQAAPARLDGSLLGFVQGNLGDPFAWGKSLRDAIGESTAVADVSIDVSVRVGLAPIDKSKDAGQAVEQALAALEAGRREGRDVTVYAPEHTEIPHERLSLMTDLTRGLACDELSVAYQPKQCLRTGEIVGVEALLRWHHPQRGVVSPEVFVRAAEETGHIRRVTEWLVDRMVEDTAKLAKADTHLSVAFNLSAGLLGDTNFAMALSKKCARAHLPITVEITETALIRDTAAVAQVVAFMRTAGLTIAIDDYGAGLSSLSYLKLIDADELKLDKAFVASLTSNERDRVLTKSTIELAHRLGMKITAEGVETHDTRALLQVMGCDAIQGYVFARPMPCTELHALLHARAAQIQEDAHHGAGQRSASMGKEAVGASCPRSLSTTAG